MLIWIKMLFYSSQSSVPGSSDLHLEVSELSSEPKEPVIDLTDSHIHVSISSSVVNSPVPETVGYFKARVESSQTEYETLQMQTEQSFCFFLNNFYDSRFNVMSALSTEINKCQIPEFITVPNTPLTIFDVRSLQPNQLLNGQV
jgi:hypothetical protein